jgi:hypothetical protein
MPERLPVRALTDCATPGEADTDHRKRSTPAAQRPDPHECGETGGSLERSSASDTGKPSQRRRPAGASGSGRKDGLSPREAGLIDIQRTAGNRAAAALVQPAYEPTRKEKAALSRWITIRWDQHEDDVADISTKITKWCSSHDQAALLSELTYEDFKRLQAEFPDADAAVAKHGSLEKAAAAQPMVSTPQPQTKTKPVNPHAEAKRQIRNHHFNVSDFTEADLVLIETSKDEPGVGWAKAIAGVRGAKIEAETAGRLNEERTIRYAAAKATGDSRFADALAKRVWATAHVLAVSGSSASANPNITLAGDAATRDEALDAIKEWRKNPTIVTGLVDRLHVPGKKKPIQDKAHRETNPDPERRFQADFCSYWGNTKINVHVDVKTSSIAS